ncbi:hypothetical protein AAEX37_00556 [Oligella sp. MSHR50489EDL]|uniref:DUF2169 family type VI secretion system accessory protein n=1 Tax=Oligella sp. MSHR50489EDL TaxID=3139409 RepID=UPI003D817C34
MKISKATPLSLQVRPYRWRGQSRIGLSVLVMVDAAEMMPILETETILWEIAKSKMDCGGVVEYGVPKVNPEFLVSGIAYSAFAEKKNEVDVTVQVNDKVRTLRVFGERQYIDKRITKAADFEQIPMNWSHSYGGLQFSNNPEGKGHIDLNEHRSIDSIPMPNIESPEHLLQEPTRSHTSYNFGAQSMMWPVRFNKIGTYTEAWKKTDFPGFFPDMDPTLFNAAQAEQIWSELSELPPNTEFAVSHMHPEKAVWKGRVPAWRGRCVLILQQSPETQIITQDAFLKLKTLWLIPHLEKYLLIFQDSVPCWHDDGSEIKHVLAALEWGHSPKEQSHYLRFMEEREDFDRSALLAYSDEDLLPENVQYHGLDPKPGNLGAMSEKLHKLQHYMHTIAREHIESMGLEADYYLPEQVGPQPRPDLRYLPEQQRWQDQRIEQMRQHLNQVKEARQRYALSKGIDKELNELTGADALYERLQQDADKVRADEHTEQSRMSQLSRMEQTSTSPDARLQALEKRMWSMSAHYVQGKYVLSNERQEGRERLLERIARGESLEALDLSGVDLSDLVFKDLDFPNVIFRQADLSRTTFENCRFHETAFSFAKLQNNIFKECHFESANLNQCDFNRAIFEDCRFNKLMISQLSFTQCDFNTCHFNESIWQNFKVFQSEFKQCSADGFALLHAHLQDSNFEECEWLRCAFTECEISQCDFPDNYIFRMALTYVLLKRVNLQASWLEALSIVSEQIIYQLDFSDCYIKNSCFRSLQFEACQFDRAIIENSEFSMSRFSDIRAVAMETPDSVFMRTHFVNADFTDANLTNGTFTHATFSAVNFTRVNFFRCEMGLTTIHADCIEHDNYQQQIQLEPSERG